MALDENKASHDMDRLSRMAGAIGVETLNNLSKLRLLVVGLTGVGMESAKNVILGRAEQVTVCDDALVAIEDLGTGFYFGAEHVGKATRADAAVRQLSELNPYVKVDVHKGDLTSDFVRGYSAVIVARDLPRQELVRLNAICRTREPRPVAFILAQAHGVTGTFFTDFGPAHTVTDADGEPAKSLVVEHFDPVTGRLKLTEKHGLDDGACVRLSELEGAGGSDHALNSLGELRVSRVYKSLTQKNPRTGREEKRSVQILDCLCLDLASVNAALAAGGRPEVAALAELGEWTNGGIVAEVKPRREMRFRALDQSLRNPCISDEDVSMGVYHPDQERWMPEAFGGKSMGSQIHVAYLAALEFQSRRGRLPVLHSAADADECVAIAGEIAAEHAKAPAGEALAVDKVNEDVVRRFALYMRAELPGVCAFLGGVAAQEVVKIFGKYTPHYQWMHHDHFEILHDEVPADAAPRGTRYDHLIAVLGAEAHRAMTNQRWFLVGCGALGCEYLKAIALMGIGTGPDGVVHVTDNDNIELSNLSRQFLFRSHHIGRPKSVCGSEVAREMNADLNLRTHETKVAPDTENVFDDRFWDSLTGVWNALDNVKARRYTDGKCLLHHKPLVESGTMGCKANSEIIVPGQTSSYSDTPDQDVGGIAACTLRNFPSLPVHCVEWARPEFDTLFELGPADANALLKDRDAFLQQVAREGNEATQAETLAGVRDLIESTRERTFESCVRLALRRFYHQFRNRILDLTHCFPEDTRVIEQETGADLGPFWTGSKRFPLPATFSPDDETHVDYLFSAANLYAFMLGIGAVRDRAAFLERARGVDLSPPEWAPPTTGPNLEGEEIATSSSKAGAAAAVDAADAEERRLEELREWVRALDTSKLAPLVGNELEKDDDTNFHIDFITAATNLRSRNYRIAESTRLNVKLIAGKIIPALATTTAMITGLAGMSYLAAIVRGLPRERLYNANPNLALARYNWFAPSPPLARHDREDVVDEETGATEKVRAVPDGFSSWDYVVVDRGNLTVAEFVEAFPAIHHGVKVTLLFKDGITQADIADGGARPLYSASDRRSAGMAEQMLKRPNLSDAMKERFQSQVDAAAKHNADVDRRRASRLIDLYVEQFGELANEQRNFVLLTGDFEDAEGVRAEIPTIKYVFKH